MSETPSLAEASASAKNAPHDDEQSEELPATTTISLDVRDPRGHRYKHNFYYKVPDLGERVEIGKTTHVWLPNGLTPNRETNMLAHIAGYLAVTIKFDGDYKEPSWWNMWKNYDATPFHALYTEVMAYEARFLGISGDESDEARGEAGGAGSAYADPHSTDVVGDVPTAPKRPATVIAESR